MKKLILLFGLLGLSAFSASAQAVFDENDTQSWNDVQLTAPISKQLDLVAQGTFRFGRDITRLNDRRFAVGVIYKPTKSLSFQPFYWQIRARNALGNFRNEYRLNLRVIYRLPFKKIGISHRSWFERRLRRPLNSWRYRPSITIEKEVPAKLIAKAKLFVTEEIFYDSLLKRFSRNRFSVGVNKTLSNHLSLDVFYMRQNDGFSIPGDLNVIGTSWKIKF
jgi:Protein of unknown function (DUF2490)